MEPADQNILTTEPNTLTSILSKLIEPVNIEMDLLAKNSTLDLKSWESLRDNLKDAILKVLFHFLFFLYLFINYLFLYYYYLLIYIFISLSHIYLHSHTHS